MRIESDMHRNASCARVNLPADERQLPMYVTRNLKDAKYAKTSRKCCGIDQTPKPVRVHISAPCMLPRRLPTLT